ncbi:MAG: MMPL family transporter, partial [Clostridia bacterium]|nr:MMPL family transporter [Clostridia bacterium]
VFIVLTVASIVSVFFVNLNSDFFSYLPQNSDMKEGLDFLESKFHMSATIMLGVDKVEDKDDLLPYIDEISGYEGVVSDGVMWWGTIDKFKDMNLDASLSEVAASMHIPVSSLYKMMEEMGLERRQLRELINYIKSDEFRENLSPMFHPKENMYIVVIQLNVPCASDEAIAVLNNIEKMFAPTDYEIETGGMSDVMNAMFNTTLGEIWKYVVMAVPIMLIILILTTDSLVDPFIFMITLGVSIVVNMGTNIIFNLTGSGVSAITYAASAVLQLGLAMDYTIFLMHAYSEERQKTLSNALAMERAIPRTFSTVAASALTTAGGFLAMFFMKFELGGDLGLVLAKGVILALVTVVFLQPCLMLFTTKISDKTAHRIRLPSFKKLGSFSIRHRKTIVAIAIMLLVPALIFGNGLDISYTKFVEEKENPTQVESMVAQLSNSVIVMAP